MLQGILNVHLQAPKKSYFKSLKATFWKVGHLASEAVIWKTKCLPTLLYGR